jgi:hypothetical protein
MKSRAALATATIVATAVLALAALGSQNTPLATWAPDRTLLSRLAPAVSLSGFQLRPPDGYTLQKQVHGSGRIFTWIGPPRQDGTRPYLMVSVLTPPSGVRNRYTAEGALDMMLAGVQRRRVDWKRSAAEHGRVNGLEFVRSRWSGVERTTQQKMHGFSYVTVKGSTIIQISSQDVEPHEQSALRLAEAAALTFRMP